jgi:hypothetical protein
VREPLLDAAALAPHAGVAHLALDGGEQPLQAALHDVVVSAGAHRGDGGVFADRAETKMNGRSASVRRSEGEAPAVTVKPGMV